MEKIGDDFAGNKYHIKDLINTKIVIIKYGKTDSIKHPGDIYYKIQFAKKDDGKLTLGFMTTGSKQIVKVLNQNPEIPLYRTIISRHRGYFFKEDMASDEEVLEDVKVKYNIDESKL